MVQAKQGDTVRIHYTGTLNDGTVFDSSEGRDPLEFEVGSGMIIPGLDAAIPGMTLGDAKTVNVPADQAYGPVNDHQSERNTTRLLEMADHDLHNNGTIKELAARFHTLL